MTKKVPFLLPVRPPFSGRCLPTSIGLSTLGYWSPKAQDAVLGRFLLYMTDPNNFANIEKRLNLDIPLPRTLEELFSKTPCQGNPHRRFYEALYEAMVPTQRCGYNVVCLMSDALRVNINTYHPTYDDSPYSTANEDFHRMQVCPLTGHSDRTIYLFWGKSGNSTAPYNHATYVADHFVPLLPCKMSERSVNLDLGDFALECPWVRSDHIRPHALEQEQQLALTAAPTSSAATAKDTSATLTSGLNFISYLFQFKIYLKHA